MSGPQESPPPRPFLHRWLDDRPSGPGDATTKVRIALSESVRADGEVDEDGLFKRLIALAEAPEVDA